MRENFGVGDEDAVMRSSLDGDKIRWPVCPVLHFEENHNVRATSQRGQAKDRCNSDRSHYQVLQIQDRKESRPSWRQSARNNGRRSQRACTPRCVQPPLCPFQYLIPPQQSKRNQAGRRTRLSNSVRCPFSSAIFPTQLPPDTLKLYTKAHGSKV